MPSGVTLGLSAIALRLGKLPSRERRSRASSRWLLLLGVLLLGACAESEPIGEARYSVTDALMAQILDNVRSAEGLEVVAEIDHSRLAQAAGSRRE